MNEIRFKKVMFVLALMGTTLTAFNAVRAQEDESLPEVVESFDEEYEAESSIYIDETDVYESEAETEETEAEEIEVREITTEETVSEETVPSQTEEETVEYDVPSSVINGWYVPAFNYNGNGTITYYLSDGTAFYNVEMNELELPQYAWAYTGLRGYVDYQYGSVNYLTDEEMSSFEAAAEAVLSGQGA